MSIVRSYRLRVHSTPLVLPHRWRAPFIAENVLSVNSLFLCLSMCFLSHFFLPYSHFHIFTSVVIGFILPNPTSLAHPLDHVCPGLVSNARISARIHTATVTAAVLCPSERMQYQQWSQQQPHFATIDPTTTLLSAA